MPTRGNFEGATVDFCETNSRGSSTGEDYVIFKAELRCCRIISIRQLIGYMPHFRHDGKAIQGDSIGRSAVASQTYTDHRCVQTQFNGRTRE